MKDKQPSFFPLKWCLLSQIADKMENRNYVWPALHIDLTYFVIEIRACYGVVLAGGLLWVQKGINHHQGVKSLPSCYVNVVVIHSAQNS